MSLSVRVPPTLRDFRSAIWAYRTRGDSAPLSAVWSGLIGRPYPASNDRAHLDQTIQWLCAAQDATPDGGVSAFYDVRVGEWAPSYPETTGYILPTFFDYAAIQPSGNPYRERALRMAEWLLTLQRENGAFPIGPLWPNWERKPIIFDTGQIIFGLIRVYRETGEATYLEAARRAGDWLAAVQDEDGCWRQHNTLDYIHAYNVRVAWALLEIWAVCQENRYRDAAIRNVQWTLSQQQRDGWFEYMNFRPDEDPLTHTIAYTIRGTLESGVLLSNSEMIRAARLAADALQACQARDGYLRARYHTGWGTTTKLICPTGTAQISIIWLRLYEITGQVEYLQAAETAIEHVKQMQPREAQHPGVAGGLSGSYPIYGDYEPYRNLNWAAKFFAEGLMLVHQLRDR